MERVGASVLKRTTVGQLVREKLRDPEVYVVAGIVGTMINAYGQILVPWLRGVTDPLAAYAAQLHGNPNLFIASTVLAYCFPFAVGVFMSVLTRYKSRRIESVADFPDRKPDPVFRATADGSLIEYGPTTRELLDKYGIRCAQEILGEKVWQQIKAAAKAEIIRTKVHFEPEGVDYLVTHSADNEDEDVNIYMTRLH